MTTSNGTAALAAASRFAKRQIGGLVNATAVANDIGSFGQNTLVLCAGTDGAFSLDDAFGAGAIASSIVGATPDVDQTDAAMAARLMFEAVAENLPMALRATRHGQRLEQMGHSNDVDFAANLDAFAVVPDFVDGRLVDTMTSTRIR